MRYRIYALGAGGEIVSGADLSATSDSEALHEAAEHVNLRGIEIWQGNRQVALLRPMDEDCLPRHGCRTDATHSRQLRAWAL
jgi:hypothetical protein